MVTTVRKQVSALLDGAVGYEHGLDALTVTPRCDVDPVLLAMLNEACDELWLGGWQPVELHRIVARRGHPTHASLVTDAVAAYLRRVPPATVDQRWLAQAATLGADVWWTEAATYLDQVVIRWKLDRVAVLDRVVTLLRILSELPRIEILIPPPGTVARSGQHSSNQHSSNQHSGADARFLDRVRALLAKAESTTYPAEAQSYTAKAQELITRYSIDEALLAARAGEADVVPFARRIGVDPPHESEQASLLHTVASANRCHAVWSPELGFATVFGFDADIDAVDLLYTSLLVQAHQAMARTEPPGGKAGRARLRTFRQSFLVAFAARIGERLTSAADAAFASAVGPTSGTAGGTGGVVAAAELLPVLAVRDEQVRETMRRTFPRMVRARGSRVESRAGWDSGRAAAETAALSRTVSATAATRNA
jgi:hypothetical protein